MDDDSGDEEGNESEEDIWRYTYKLEMDIKSNRVLSHDISYPTCFHRLVKAFPAFLELIDFIIIIRKFNMLRLLHQERGCIRRVTTIVPVIFSWKK